MKKMGIDDYLQVHGSEEFLLLPQLPLKDKTFTKQAEWRKGWERTRSPAKGTSQSNLQGAEPLLSDPESWPEPVDGAASLVFTHFACSRTRRDPLVAWRMGSRNCPRSGEEPCYLWPTTSISFSLSITSMAAAPKRPRVMQRSMRASRTRSPRISRRSSHGGGVARLNDSRRSHASIRKPSVDCSNRNAQPADHACGLQATG